MSALVYIRLPLGLPLKASFRNCESLVFPELGYLLSEFSSPKKVKSSAQVSLGFVICLFIVAFPASFVPLQETILKRNRVRSNLISGSKLFQK